MKIESAVNKPNRTTIRTDMNTRERIKKLAQQKGMTQEKLLELMTEQMENGMQEAVDHDPEAVDLHVPAVDCKGPGIPASRPSRPAQDEMSRPDEISNEDLFLEIKAVKKVIYRMIKELCRITDSDVSDPDSGISIRTKYDDWMKHPEKYRHQK